MDQQLDPSNNMSAGGGGVGRSNRGGTSTGSTDRRLEETTSVSDAGPSASTQPQEDSSSGGLTIADKLAQQYAEDQQNDRQVGLVNFWHASR